MHWKTILERLRGRGLSQKQIAELCGCGQPAISDLAKGATLDPRYSIGQSLKALDDSTDAQIKDRLDALLGAEAADQERKQAAALTQQAQVATDFVASTAA